MMETTINNFFHQDNNNTIHQPTTSQQQHLLNNNQSAILNTPATSTISQPHSNLSPKGSEQSSYQIKCDFLEYHIQEALLINKALKSELKQYKDKIEFEKRLKKFLINRAGANSSTTTTVASEPHPQS